MPTFLTEPQWYDKNGDLRTSEPQNVYKAEVTYDAQGHRTGAITSENFTEIYNKVINGESVKLIEYSSESSDTDSSKPKWADSWVSIGAGYYEREGECVTFACGAYTTDPEVVGNPEYRTYVGGPRFISKSWDGFRNKLYNEIYPVGYIFISTSNRQPPAFVNNEGERVAWERWGKGRVPVGVDENDADFKPSEKIGGEKTHTLTIAEMPRHGHPIIAHDNDSGVAQTKRIAIGITGSNSNEGTELVGGGAAHNNLQPYITCYMWKRVK